MNPAFDYSFLYWLALVIPSVIAGAVAIISLVTNYKSAKANALRSMVFTQKEKVADQFIEKSSELMAISDPLVLNARINEYTPTLIEHGQFMGIMHDLLTLDNRIQALGSIIKLHTYSIYSERSFPDIARMFEAIDTVHGLVQELVLALVKLHASNTEKGRLTSTPPMEDKVRIEREFSEKYKEPYIDMVVKITTVARILREEAIHAKQGERNRRCKKRKRKLLLSANKQL